MSARRVAPSTLIPGPEIYVQKDNPAFEDELATRTAAHDAAFFLPHLRPGMRLLDVGCGPGSITLGLAEIVAPAEVIGIDIQATQVAQAQKRAAARGFHTARFEVASIYELPFPDASFDAAFANAVLMHLREPARALAELHRVLRPGGVAGVRDPDIESVLHAPMTPLLEKLLALRRRMWEYHSGDVLASRHYRRLLLDAGFTHTEASASVESPGCPDGIQRQAAFLKAVLPGFARVALPSGWIDQATLNAIPAEVDSWARRPDAFFARTWCEAVGWRAPVDNQQERNFGQVSSSSHD